MAVKAFADSLMVIPTTLAENAGLDPLDIVAQLKAAYSEGKKNIGLDLSQHNVGVLGKPGDMLSLGILDQGIRKNISNESSAKLIFSTVGLELIRLLAL